MMINLSAAADANSSGEFIIAVLQIAVAVLSVPVIATVLGGLWRFVQPTERLRSRLKRDLAVFKDLPESDQKNEYKEHINKTVGRLNARLTNPWRPRAIRVTAVVVAAIGLVGVVIAFIGSITNIGGFFAKDGFLSSWTWTALSVGAIFTALALLIRAVAISRDADYAKLMTEKLRDLGSE